MITLKSFQIDDSIDIFSQNFPADNSALLLQSGAILQQSGAMPPCSQPSRLSIGGIRHVEFFENDNEYGGVEMPEPQKAKAQKINQPPTQHLDEDDITKLLNKVDIKISEYSDYSKIKVKKDSEFYRAKFGMQLVVPRGKIEKLRYCITLQNRDSSNENNPADLYAHDGFPKSDFKAEYVINGTVTLHLSKALEIIPDVGGVLANIVDVSISPWQIKLGEIVKAKRIFSGGLTANPQWYFEGDSINNEFEVSLIIKKSKKIPNIDAQIQAFWEYDPGVFKKVKMGSAMHTITL